jgi:hypothetical protein
MTPSSLLVELAENQFSVISHRQLPGTVYLAAMPRANPTDPHHPQT